ncbi:winged helix-turn-helix transcriptional regulator [Pedobacter nanyangensis]|uniref:winged helix-turn-helix transcriptional regulator n=1 Tax=Pedobacter nanyangensis TaxID=1562389 RepID=UPI001966A852|nr:winged helix-turn-helix transcriptional regulator [Pedobacter nanyangensis]
MKQLEQDQLIIRNARPEVPPYVTYHLSNAGNGLVPIITSMAKWAFRDINGAFKQGELRYAFVISCYLKS